MNTKENMMSDNDTHTIFNQGDFLTPAADTLITPKQAARLLNINLPLFRFVAMRAIANDLLTVYGEGEDVRYKWGDVEALKRHKLLQWVWLRKETSGKPEH